MNTSVMIILILFAIGAAGAALYWYAFRFEPVNFKLSEISIFIRSSKKNSSNVKGRSNKKGNDPQLRKTAGRNEPLLTILHLSDFHLRKDKKGDKLFHFINGLKVLKPDLILITGDLVEKNEYFSYLIEMLSGFIARLGKYAVFGVHDYYDKTIKEFTKNMLKRKKEYRRENDVMGLSKNLDSVGIRVLRNSMVRIALKEIPDSAPGGTWERYHHRLEGDQIGEVQIIGLEDAIIEKTDIALAFKELNADFKNNYSGASSARNRKEYFKQRKSKVHNLNNSGSVRICITHTPDMDMMVELVKRGIDIILCGHTHGGQVRLPGVGALLTGSKIKARFASGLFYFRDFVLYTSRGLGEGRYSPFRFYCQPEASLISIFKC